MALPFTGCSGQNLSPRQVPLAHVELSVRTLQPPDSPPRYRPSSSPDCSAAARGPSYNLSGNTSFPYSTPWDGFPLAENISQVLAWLSGPGQKPLRVARTCLASARACAVPFAWDALPRPTRERAGPQRLWVHCMEGSETGWEKGGMLHFPTGLVSHDLGLMVLFPLDL